MSLTYCDTKDPAEAGQLFWIMMSAFPGEYFSRTYIKLFLHDLPETWKLHPPIADHINLNSTVISVNISFTLPDEPVGYSSLNACCILINNDNIPSVISKCFVKSVIHSLSGSVVTIPEILWNERIKINTKIKCTGAVGTPVPVYKWIRLSDSKIPFQVNTIPDLITNNEFLLIDDRKDIRGNIYKYRCEAKQYGNLLDLVIQFVISLCDHEPMIDINLAVNTQIHTICGINNVQGTEFFSSVYQPFLQRMILSLPISPQKVRISLVPFLNYENRHNASYLPLSNAMFASQVVHLLHQFKSQYSSPISKPCDGMELSCSGNGFYNLFKSKSSIRQNIPSVAIIGRDVSACLNHNQDKLDMDQYAHLLTKYGISIWLHYFSEDISLLEPEEQLIKPNKTFKFIESKHKENKIDFCCDMSKNPLAFSINASKFLDAICAESSLSQDPLANPIISIKPELLYSGIEVEIRCRGDPGFPNGRLYLCLVPDLASPCEDHINISSKAFSVNEMFISSNFTMLPQYDGWYINCIATNDVQTIQQSQFSQ